MQGKERTYKLQTQPGSVVIKSPTEREKRALRKIASQRTDEDDTAWIEHTIKQHVASADTSHRGVSIKTTDDVLEFASLPTLVEITEEIMLETSLSVGEAQPSGEPSGS